MQPVFWLWQKNKTENKILFIDASNEFKKEMKNNILEESNIQTIINEFRDRKEIKHFSRYVDSAEIERNEYNLTVSTYVRKEEVIETVDIVALNKEIDAIVQKINFLRSSINNIIQVFAHE